VKEILLVLVLILAVAWLVVRIRRGNDAEADARPSLRPARKDPTYHAVSIKYGPTACNAAKALAGVRFLSTEAPRLPLPECDAGECQCRFAHHPDRRSNRDRRSPFAPGGFGGGTGSFAQERREKKDRRKSADPDDF